MSGNNNPPTPGTTNKIEEILEGVVDWADSGHTDIGRPNSTLTPEKATHQIKRLIDEAYQKGKRDASRE